MEKTLIYLKKGEDLKKNAKLSHIYRPCCREPTHTHPMETRSMRVREWPSKWWGTLTFCHFVILSITINFIVIDKMRSWHPWAESVGLGEEIGMMKVFKCLFSWTATDLPLGLRPIGIGRVSAVYVFSCRQQRFLINHQTLVVYKQASDFQSLNNILLI